MCGGDFYEGKFLQDKILMLVCKWLLLVAQKREREREKERERERKREREWWLSQLIFRLPSFS